MRDDNALGRRIRELRRIRHLSLDAAAGLAGMSRSMLSYIERGERALERRSHVQGLAYALRISPDELLGQPYPLTGDDRASAQAHIEGIRSALMVTGIGHVEDANPVERPVGELVANAGRARTALCRDADYSAAAAGLADILVGLHVHTAGPAGRDQERALRALVLACCTACAIAKELGYSDLAWVAAERARHAAQAIDDPVLDGLASTYVCYALQTHVTKLSLSLRAIGRIEPHVGSDPLAMQVYGQLQLRAAHDSAVTGRPAADYLAEAYRVGERTGERTDYGIYFGPTNIGIWDTAIAIEQGEGGRAARIAEQVNITAMPSRQRQAMFYADLGRALAQDRQHAQALDAFLTAERLAPVFVHSSPFARDAVLDIRDRARRASVGRELSALVYRMGLI
ncbi:MAG TPA: helix-turn-helix transcriptional regulator [Mycobacteriales bacterium]|nr:helix-turn-helix transcriptional regulator [Mycobacteriales bacterium]